MGVVNAKVNLADTDVDHHHLARRVSGQRQGVGVVGLGDGARLGGNQINRHGARAFSEQAGEITDRFGVGQDVGIEDFLRDHQHEATVAGDDVGNDAVAGEQ